MESSSWVYSTTANLMMILTKMKDNSRICTINKFSSIRKLKRKLHRDGSSCRISSFELSSCIENIREHNRVANQYKTYEEYCKFDDL